MSVLSVSNLSVQSSLTSILQSEQASLTQLSIQLSSQQKYNNLTDYSASDARNLVNLQATATQKQAYINVITTVNNNLSIYNTTLTDLESVTAQAQDLASTNPNYDVTTASNIAAQATSYLQSVGVDLNQQVNGRYLYSGTRYNTSPVQNLSALPTSTLSSTIYTDGSTLPSYDTEYAASALTMATAGQTVTIGGTVGTPQNATVTVNGTAYTYAIQAGDTTTTIAAGLSALIAVDIPGTSSTGAVLTVGGTGTINSASAYAASSASYAKDQATVDTGYTISYGITSNDPAFQKVIAGLRYLQAAANSGDPTTYSTDMAQAATLLTAGLTSLQSLNTSVAYNINAMTSEKAAQKASINNLTEQVANIQQVDVTQVSTEITAMETILQASYAVTGDIEKMSIVSYLPT